MNIDAYLERIRHVGDLSPTFENLALLHNEHLEAVPFENLDIPLGRKIELSLPHLYQKVVVARRGGFCYELNSLFAWLLRELGYDVSFLSARVFDGTELGPPFDHMALLVQLPDQQVLADVGFGDSFRTPLIFNGPPQTQVSGTYQILPGDEGFSVYQSKADASPAPQFTFSLTPFSLVDFEPMCHYHQTSEQSGFTQKQVCTLATPEGRVTISNGRLIQTNLKEGSKTETPIKTIDDYRRLLQGTFGMDLSYLSPLDNLMILS